MPDLLPVPDAPDTAAVIDDSIPTTVVESTPAPVETAATSLRDLLSDTFDIPEGVSDEDFKNSMLEWYERSSQVGSDDINQLRQMAVQYQQIAPQLTEFQKWQQSQQAKPEPEVVDEWAMPELTAVEQALVKPGENGRFVPVEPADPVAVAAATKANQRAAVQESIGRLAITNPKEYALRALKSELDRREAAFEERLKQFESRLTPLQQQQQAAAQQAEFDAFVEANSSLFIKLAEDGKTQVWSEAAGRFSQEFQSLTERGVDPVVARDIALRLAQASAPVTPATPATPAAPIQPKAPNPQRAATRAIEVAKARVPQVDGKPVVPAGRARTLSQLVETKSREFAASSGAT